jgi:hypothetical protein
MRIEKTVTFSLIMILAFSFVAVPNARSQSEVVLSVSPSRIIDVPKSLSTITVNVTFTSAEGPVEGLNHWDIEMRYNPVLLQTNSSLITLGPLFNSVGSLYFHFELDYIHIGWSIPTQDSVSGEGTLVTITFIVKGRGGTSLDLYYAKLFDMDGNAFLSTSQGGYFRNVDSTLIPRADFIYYADSYNVTFNASSSFSSGTVIQKYFWIWGDKNSLQSNTTEPVIWHTYLEEIPPGNGRAAVRLFVTDSLNVTSNILLKVITFGIAIHDVAVTSIESSPKSVLVGNFSSTTISVNLTNLGNHLENASISISYNSTSFDFNVSATQWILLQIQGVNNLAGFENRTLAFSWNTTGFSPGFYALKAEASLVIGESNITNNVLTGSLRIVTVLFAPLASFIASPRSPRIGENVVFDASQSYDRDGRIVEYAWNFGDSALQTVTLQPTIDHVYQKAGGFNVTLAVTDDDGFSRYAVFLVTVSKVTSAVAISLPSSTAIVNSTFTFWGQVLSVESPVNVTIFYRVYGQLAWSVLANTTTDSAGLFSCGWMPSKPGAYQFKATWEGDDKFLGASSSVALATAKFLSNIALSLSKDSATVGDSLAISVHLTPARYGAAVAIMVKQGDGSWSLLSEISTDENGLFSLVWKPSTLGTYMFRAEWIGDDQSLGAESLMATVTVGPRSGPVVNYLPYVVAAVIVVLIVAFLWGFRKVGRGSK